MWKGLDEGSTQYYETIQGKPVGGGEGTAGNTTFKKLQLNWYLKHKQDLAQQDKWPGKKKVGTSVSSVLRQRFRVQRKKRIQETK